MTGTFNIINLIVSENNLPKNKPIGANNKIPITLAMIKPNVKL